jgi:lycopene beta-cyclase
MHVLKVCCGTTMVLTFGRLRVTCVRTALSTPGLRRLRRDTLLQHFYGWEVETDKDVFDPTTVTLMDFSAAVTNGVHFFYVLPFSARSALIETTHFSLDLSTQEQYEAELGHYLRHRYGLSHWHTSRIEQGVLPMA